jgi:hypothetical protein
LFSASKVRYCGNNDQENLKSKKIILNLHILKDELPNRTIKMASIAEKTSIENIDETDLRILRELQKDSHVTTKELAARVHLSSTPVFERVRQNGA